MLCGDVLEARAAHRTCAQNHLTGPRIERLEKLDNTTHRVRRECLQIDDDLEIISERTDTTGFAMKRYMLESLKIDVGYVVQGLLGVEGRRVGD